VLLKPLPFPAQDRLIQVWEAVPARAIQRTTLTEGYCWDVLSASRSLADFGCLHSASFTLTGTDAPERVSGAIVAPGFLRTLGVSPVVGRIFDAAEARPDAPNNVALLGHDLWATRFASDRSVVGRTIALGGRPYVVVGVLPAGSPWLDTDVFVPFVQRGNPDRTSWEYFAIGRLKPGVSMAAAAADFDRVAVDLEQRYPKENKGVRIALAPSTEWVASDDLRRMLWVLLGAALLLLVIACVNVANLQLAHAASRARNRRAHGARSGTMGPDSRADHRVGRSQFRRRRLWLSHRVRNAARLQGARPRRRASIR